jgi:hypothetical protein
MRPAVDNIDMVTGFGQFTRMDRSGESCTDNEDRRIQGSAIKQTC